MTDPTDLRARLVAAFQAAAYDCDGACGLAEAECDDTHPVQPAAWAFGVVSGVRGPVTSLADVALGVVQAELDRLQVSREKWATESTRQAGQIGDLRRQLAEAVNDLEAWDELRAQAHEQMRAGFAEAIRGKWDAEASEPDADMAADAVIDYLENEYAGQMAKVTAERDRVAAEVRGLEEAAAEQQQNALHWQERAEVAEAEAERLNTDLAAYDLHHNGPPLRHVRDLPDIDQHQETSDDA